MIKKTGSQGFTLIELLVVILILGMIMAVVLVALNDAREKGVNSKIKSNLANIRSEASLFFNQGTGTFGSYINTGTTIGACPGTSGGGTSVFSDPQIRQMIREAALAVGGTDAGATMSHTACKSNPASWVAAVMLKTKEGVAQQAWCVDSTGVSKQGSPGAAGATFALDNPALAIIRVTGGPQGDIYRCR
jgi:prepilin-type N-terminal cleavage/methylation domain-containing protein